MVQKVLQHQYLLQPYLNIQDKEQYPCDIRLFMEKTKQVNGIQLERQ